MHKVNYHDKGNKHDKVNKYDQVNKVIKVNGENTIIKINSNLFVISP